MKYTRSQITRIYYSLLKYFSNLYMLVVIVHIQITLFLEPKISLTNSAKANIFTSNFMIYTNTKSA